MTTNVIASPIPPPLVGATNLSPQDTACHAVAVRLRAGASVALLEQEQKALIAALASPPFSAAMMVAFVQEMKTQQPNPAYDMSLADAGRDMHAILTNRIRDAQQRLAELSDAGFMAAAQQEATQPAVPKTPYELPTEKSHMIVDRLVQENNPAGAEPTVHVAASALGQRITHQALANLFRPNGVMRALLVHELAQAWPDGTAAAVEQLAQDWLQARHDAAHSVADGLKPDGALYLAATKRATELQNQKSAAQAIPALQITVPTPGPARLINQPDLVMDM